MEIDKQLAFLNYPVHWPTYAAAVNGERGGRDWWLRHPIEKEKALKMCRRCLFLMRLRKATNGKYGRHFGIEYPS